MSLTIWRFPIEVRNLQRVVLPRGRILSVTAQDGELTLWALVDPDLPMVEAADEWVVSVRSAGHDCTGLDAADHVGTVRLHEDGLVLHVFAARVPSASSTPTSAPAPSTPAAPTPTPPPTPDALDAHTEALARGLPGARAWPLARPQDAGRFPAACRYSGEEARCCVWSYTWPLCREALVAVGLEAVAR